MLYDSFEWKPTHSWPAFSHCLLLCEWTLSANYYFFILTICSCLLKWCGGLWLLPVTDLPFCEQEGKIILDGFLHQSLWKLWLHTDTIADEYLVPINWHITVFPSPLLQVGDPTSVTCIHMKRSEGGISGVVGAIQNEECHQDDDGHKDHHRVALLSLQSKQKWWNIT